MYRACTEEPCTVAGLGLASYRLLQQIVGTRKHNVTLRIWPVEYWDYNREQTLGTVKINTSIGEEQVSVLLPLNDFTHKVSSETKTSCFISLKISLPDGNNDTLMNCVRELYKVERSPVR